MWAVIVWLLTLLAVEIAGDSVHIYYSYPELRTTSSTLRWVWARNSSQPGYAVIATHEILPAEEESNVAAAAVDAVKERPVYVCRARHEGVWVSGLLRTGDSHCQISFLGRVLSSSQYEVLENVLASARLSWVLWGPNSSLLPKGAVAGGESYVARRRVDKSAQQTLGLLHNVGHFDPNEGIGRVIVIENGEERKHHDGEVLVEAEPISYEIIGLGLKTPRIKVGTVKELGSAILRNDQSDGTVKVDSVIAYDNLLSMNWGQGRAMLKGLNTTIRLSDGKMEEINWGIPYTEDRKDVYRIEAMLEPGTAVNVTLRGNQTESEVPYSGKLVAVYEDLQTRARSISGVLIENAMRELRAEYSAVYWLHDSSLVPTTTTTSTTTTTTTTSTTTTTIRPQDDIVRETVPHHKNISLASAPLPSSSSSLLYSASLVTILSTFLRIT